MASEKFKWPKSPWFWIFIGWWLIPVVGLFWLIYQGGAKLYTFIETQYNKKLSPDQQVNSRWGKIGSGVLAIIVVFGACGTLTNDTEKAENMIETAESQLVVSPSMVEEESSTIPVIEESKETSSEEPSEEISEPSEEASAPVMEESSESGKSLVVESSETVDYSLQFISCPESVSRGSTMRVKIQGKPNTKYTITVQYKSGPSKAKGLEAKTTNDSGEASWSWDIGINASTSYVPSITISGGGETISADFKVTE